MAAATRAGPAQRRVLAVRYGPSDHQRRRVRSIWWSVTGVLARARLHRIGPAGGFVEPRRLVDVRCQPRCRRCEGPLSAWKVTAQPHCPVGARPAFTMLRAPARQRVAPRNCAARRPTLRATRKRLAGSPNRRRDARSCGARVPPVSDPGASEDRRWTLNALAGLGGIRLDLPLHVDVPADHHPDRGFRDEDSLKAQRHSLPSTPAVLRHGRLCRARTPSSRPAPPPGG